MLNVAVLWNVKVKCERIINHSPFTIHHYLDTSIIACAKAFGSSCGTL